MKNSVLSNFLILALLSGCVTGSAIDRPSIFSTLTGKWDTDNPPTCESYRAISFSDDGKTITVSYPDNGYASEFDARSKFEYDILDVNESWLRMALQNEQRLDADGKPVVWVLKLVDENTFCWGRDDWPSDGCTPPRFRCEN